MWTLKSIIAAIFDIDTTSSLAISSIIVERTATIGVEFFVVTLCLKSSSTEVCKINPACLKIPAPSAARKLDQPSTAQSANFGKFWINYQNLGGTI